MVLSLQVPSPWEDIIHIHIFDLVRCTVVVVVVVVVTVMVMYSLSRPLKDPNDSNLIASGPPGTCSPDLFSFLHLHHREIWTISRLQSIVASLFLAALAENAPFPSI